MNVFSYDRARTNYLIEKTDLLYVWLVTYQGNSSNRDFGGDQSTADNGKTGAKGVAKNTANTHAVNVFSGSQNNGGDLRAVTPFSKERHCERLKC